MRLAGVAHAIDTDRPWGVASPRDPDGTTRPITRYRSREISATGSDIHSRGAHRVLPCGLRSDGFHLAAGPFEGVPAGHRNDVRRMGVTDRRPGNRYRWDAGAAERIDAAGHLHHFGNPVAACIRRIEPLQTDDAHWWSISDRRCHSGESLPKR